MIYVYNIKKVELESYVITYVYFYNFKHSKYWFQDSYSFKCHLI
jgi:hypothetical protein